MEMAEAPPSELRIVLLGWTDSGKTSSANTILDREAFCTEKETEECEKQGGFVDGRQVTVVDTQGWKRIASLTFFKKEIVRGVELCPPGPHALLLVMRLDKDVETDSLQELLGLLSTRVWNCTIVLFTHGDAVGGMTDLERRIQKKDVYKQLLEKCGHRYHVFDNNKREVTDQVTELLKKIDKMVEGNTERFLPSKEIHTVFITQQLTRRRKSIKQPPSMKDETSESKSPSEEKSDVAEAAQMSEVPPASTSESELRLVLLGRTGSGKSAAGNTILGEETFESQASSSPVTQETKKKKEVIAGRKVALVDTTDWLWLTEQCGHRYHVLKNHVLKDNTQVDELLRKVDEMINKHNGRSYCSEKYRAVESHIKHVQKHLLMERQKQENTEEKLSKQQREMKNIEIELNESKQRLKQQKKDIDDLKEELRNEREQNEEKQRLLQEAQEGKRREEIKLKELGERYKKVKENYNELVKLRQTEEEKAREDTERHRDTLLKLSEITAESTTAAQQLRDKEEERKRLETEMEKMLEACHEKDRKIEGLRQTELEKNREIDRLTQIEEQKDREIDRLKQTEEQKDEAMDRLKQDNKKKDEIIKRLEADLESARTIAAQATAVMQESEQSSKGETREEQIQRGRDSLQSLRSIAQRLSTLPQEISGNLDVQEGEDREDITPQRP